MAKNPWDAGWPVIDESMWLLLEVAVSNDPRNAKKIIGDFCTEYRISPQVVMQRMSVTGMRPPPRDRAIDLRYSLA